MEGVWQADSFGLCLRPNVTYGLRRKRVEGNLSPPSPIMLNSSSTEERKKNHVGKTRRARFHHGRRRFKMMNNSRHLLTETKKTKPPPKQIESYRDSSKERKGCRLKNWNELDFESTHQQHEEMKAYQRWQWRI